MAMKLLESLRIMVKMMMEILTMTYNNYSYELAMMMMMMMKAMVMRMLMLMGNLNSSLLKTFWPQARVTASSSFLLLGLGLGALPWVWPTNIWGLKLSNHGD